MYINFSKVFARVSQTIVIKKMQNIRTGIHRYKYASSCVILLLIGVINLFITVN